MKKEISWIVRLYIRFYYSSLRVIFKVISVFAFIIIIFSVFLFISWDKQILPYYVYAIESGSMEPMLERGDLIIVKRESDYNVGDVVTFYLPHRKEYITHRIVRIENNMYYTKGDANDSEDNYGLLLKDISGKFKYKIGYLGFGVIFLRTVTGVIACIVVPSSLLLGMIVSDFGRKIKKYGDLDI